MRETETSAPSLGGNYAVMPLEPTVAMCRAAIDENTTSHLTEAHRRILMSGYARVYRAMLAAAPPTAMAEAVASARAEGRKEALSELATKADEQLAYWRRRMGDEKTMEDGVSEDGSNYTPIGDEAAWDGGYCNGRLSEADWWGWTIRGLIPAPPTLIPGGSSDV